VTPALPALTGQTRLFEHRSNCRVQPVNAGSAVVDGVLVPVSGSFELVEMVVCWLLV
jgi:hypothetical protein